VTELEQLMESEGKREYILLDLKEIRLSIRDRCEISSPM